MNDIATLSADMARTASGFLESLSAEQRAKVMLPFSNEKERHTWYYTPTPRVGLALREMTPPQEQWLRRLLALGLSEGGYNHIATVMGLEYLVDYGSGFPDRTWGDQEDTRVRDPQNYTVTVFGTPGDEAGWSWRVGGHHVSLHFTLKDGSISPLPIFTGAEPAHYPMPGGKYMRPLEAQEDLARELLALLRPEQRAQAVISEVPPTDIVQTNRPRVEEGAINDSTGGGPSGSGLRAQLGLTPVHEALLRYTTQPKGLPVKDMDARQREALRRLIGVYFDYVAEPVAAQYASVLAPERLDATTFAWAGPDNPGGPMYYRIQGERLLIEYDCTQNNANHTHSVWRDPQGDFGADVLAQHYAASHATEGAR
jgi:hypothetical protein